MATPLGVTVRTLNDSSDADYMNRVFVRCGMVPAPVDTIWNNHLHEDAVTYLLAVRDDDGAVVGTVTGVDHELLFSDPEHGFEPVDTGGRSGRWVARHGATP